MFEKYQKNIKFHENASSGSRTVPCRRTDTTKLIVAFRNFANAPKTDRHWRQTLKNINRSCLTSQNLTTSHSVDILHSISVHIYVQVNHQLCWLISSNKTWRLWATSVHLPSLQHVTNIHVHDIAPICFPVLQTAAYQDVP